MASDPIIQKSRARHWAYTFNNYGDHDVERLSLLPDGATYHVFGFEVGESGTPHLQGHLSFAKQLRLAQVKKCFEPASAHLTVCRNVHASVLYCKKGGDFREFGKPPDAPGHRSDLEGFKQSVKDGTYDLRTIREQYSQVYAKYPRFCLEYIRDNLPPQKVESHPLRGWQETLNGVLRREPLKRIIHFVVDVRGNAGKSWFVDYFSSLHERVLTILPGKKADMIYAFATCGFTPRVIFVDCPRSKQGDYIQYDFLEELKNGRIFNSKYESSMLRFEPPHVVVCMNEKPDMSKLSEDRYDIIEI